jgi:hypothetical protein
MIHVNPGAFSQDVHEYHLFLSGKITKFDESRVPEKIREYMTKGIMEWIPNVRMHDKTVQGLH